MRDAEKNFIFMGFCPDGKIANRLDREWIASGRCHFDYIKSERQLERFGNIVPGEIIILKKREVFGKTMKLYRCGKVKNVLIRGRSLEVDWAKSDEIVEVPLMGCNSTVDVRSFERLKDEMPKEFWAWLNQGS